MPNKVSASYEDASTNRASIWMFIIPSLLGLLLFMTPIAYEDGVTIPIAILASEFKALLGTSAPSVVTGLICIAASLSVITTVFKPLHDKALISTLFLTSYPWLILRVLGAVFAMMTVNGIGPELIWHEYTGGLVLNELMPTLLSVFLFAGLLLPLLLDFGLLELAGSLMSKIMRPLFNLPGRSSIDCITSWLGDGTVGIMLTSQQYEQNMYTKREAAVIATTFSAVSISFALVVVSQVELEHLFLPFYFAVSLAGFIAALIIPRLPPLRWKANAYLNGEQAETCELANKSLGELWRLGIQGAIARAEQSRGAKAVLVDGAKNAAEMVFCVLPVVMAIGTLALVVAENTSIFSILGQPFIPLLELLSVPEAVKASETLVVGFADMFIPSIMAASIDNEMTRFVIAAVSITQLIYLSEVGALILGSRIPINLLEMFVIFILRTLITLPVIAGVAHLVF
ncbi:YjiH family protein [Marinomonas ostreistagni]|uniref:YjiH family protein n=1 Tax=Marinomonas ostreistagni TaxID=359209 RepID=A0ABS0Z5X6_9GAMM|nr:YjiH family protein [Marinomonas ostreistagni]MBJ7549055.1 YjiH family protein [Marinomonas ostreistagni]